MNNKYYIKNFKTVFNNEKVIVSTLSVINSKLRTKLYKETHMDPQGRYDFFRIENGRAIEIDYYNVYNWYLWGYNLVNIFEDENGYYFISI